MFKQLLIICIAVLCSFTAEAQQRSIRGLIIDATNGEPLPAANVVQKGTTNGTFSDGDGRFYMNLLDDAEQALVISYIGYEIKELLVLEGRIEFIIRLERSEDYKLDEVRVISSRATALDPVTQTTITRAEIQQRYAGQDPSAVIEELTPSIQSFSDAGSNIGNYVQFRLRGIDQTRINTTLNGVPLNDMIDQGVFFSNFSDFSNSVESIQVQRGVGLSSNGTASYAGSVNFESVNLDADKPSVGVQITGGAFNTFRSSADVKTGKLSNDLAFYTRVTRTQSDGFKDNSGSDSYSIFFSGGYLGEKQIFKVTGFAGKTQNDQSYLPVLLTDIENDPRQNNNHPNDTDDFEQELIQFQYSNQLSNELILNATAYYGGARGVFPFGLSDTNQLLFGLENDHYGLISDITYQKNALTITGGIHTYLFERENINSTAPNTTNPDYQDETDKTEFSSFARASYDFGNLSVHGDVQLRYVDLEFRTDQVLSFGGPVPAGAVTASRDWLFLNPRLGWRYRFNAISSIYGSAGQTSREPTRTDILQGDGSAINEFNLASVQDENIVTEESVIDWELGYNYQGWAFKADVNAFFMFFEDEISLVGGLANNSYVPLRQNIESSQRFGLEWLTEYKLNYLLTLNFNGTYMQTNVDEFVQAPGVVFNDVNHIFAPDWNAFGSARFTLDDNLPTLTFSGRYVSDTFIELSNNSAFTTPEYTVFNIQADYAFNENVALSLFFNNIFDELYFTEGAPVDADFDGNVEGPGFRVQPPRHAFLQLRVNF